MNDADHKAWGDFWAKQKASGGGGCLPDGWNNIERAQQEQWQAFAARIPQSARLLDLATGDGRVMGWLLEMRPDIACTGVDLAPVLPPAPVGTTSLAAVAMEQLPFADNSFDCVVSQFGFEYGDVATAAAEIARVLAPGGIVGLLTHRIDGPILAHNRERRRQIGWVFDRKGLFALARQLLALRGDGFAATPAAIASVVAEGAQRFGSGSVAWEIAEAVRQTLMLPKQVAAAEIAATLASVEEQARNEIGRINSLERACQVTAADASFAAAISAGGLHAVSVRAVKEAEGGNPFADFRILQSGN